jgi:DNA-binding transcriptional MerR regulator
MIPPKGRVTIDLEREADMRIGELAAETGTTPRALRHYEQAGLITCERAANGYRYYADGTTVRVRNIRRLLDAGLTLDDVRVFLPCLDGDVTAGPASDKALRVSRRYETASPPR